MGGPTGVKRVKSGCVTCRIRRVRCDEDKPECRRCVSTGRKCDGYSTLPFSRRDLQAASQSSTRQVSPFAASEPDGLLSRLVTDPAFSDVLEKRYFQFFRHRTVASTNGIVDSRFWDRVVLQACHTEPAVKHAVLALSSLHQLSILPQDCDTNYQHRLYAERQHHKALEEARVLIASSSQQDVDRILIACIIFIIFEGVRGEYQAAAMHMDSGRAIMAQNFQRFKHPARRKDLVEIEHALARLDLPAICFSDRRSPYRYTLADFHQTNPTLTVSQFQDVHEAQACLVDLTRCLLVIGNHIDFEDLNGDLESLAHFQAAKVRCATTIEQWHEQFLDVVRRSDSASSCLTLNLRSWYTADLILIKAETYGPETRFDKYLELWQQIVDYCEQIAESLADPNQSKSFSFDLGYMIPVFLTATRCRDPWVRRHAITLLQSHPRQEGVWQSVGAAAVAARWMAVEEDGLGEVKCAADIPEHKRIRFIDTQIEVDSKQAEMRVTTTPGERPLDVSAVWKQESPNTGTAA